MNSNVIAMATDNNRRFRNVRFAHKRVEPLSDKDFREKYADRVRHGKTDKDRKNGNHQRAHERRLARAEWYRDTKWNSAGNFPV